MSKSNIKVTKTKHGLLIMGDGMEFIRHNGAFYEVDIDTDEKTGYDVRVRGHMAVSASDARTIVNEHDIHLELKAKIDALGLKSSRLIDKRDAIQRQINAFRLECEKLTEELDKLQNQTTDNAHDVIHTKTHIKIGCNSVPIELARKLVGGKKR